MATDCVGKDKDKERIKAFTEEYNTIFISFEGDFLIFRLGKTKIVFSRSTIDRLMRV